MQTNAHRQAASRIRMQYRSRPTIGRIACDSRLAMSVRLPEAWNRIGQDRPMSVTIEIDAVRAAIAVLLDAAPRVFRPIGERAGRCLLAPPGQGCI
jgi:hypothetical protein